MVGLADVDHAVSSMLLAIQRGLTAFSIEAGSYSTRVVRALSDAYVNHAVHSVLHAIQRPLTAFSIEAGNLRAGVA